MFYSKAFQEKKKEYVLRTKKIVPETHFTFLQVMHVNVFPNKGFQS